LSSVTPGEKFVDTGDLVVSDAAEDSDEPSLWIDAIELGSLNQGEGGCHEFATSSDPANIPLCASGQWFGCMFA
tara:strand:+ start:8567 stop:8788 length:222 start_codon:yes stop_codon:yes gene_type:complete